MANSKVFSDNPEALQDEPFGESLGGFWPEPGSLTTTTTIGDITNLKIDSRGNLATRSPITTDEGSVREDFPGTEIYDVIGGTITFTNNSKVVTGVSTNFTNGRIQYADYIKLSSALDTAYAKIESVISDTELLLENVYTGTSGSGLGHHAKFKPVGAVGAITVDISICSIASGNTSNSTTKVFRNVDYGPLIFASNAAITQRIANQTGYLGLTDDPISPTVSAYFVFDGTSELSIKTVTQSSAGVADIETNTIALLQPTSLQRRYRINLAQEYVAFYIDDILVATHKIHIPGPYVYMDGFAGWVNGVSPASTTTMAVDSIFIANFDSLIVATDLITSTSGHESLGGFWPEPGTLTTLTTIGEKTDYKVDSRGNLSVRGPITTDEGSVREDFSGTQIYYVEGGTVTFINNSTVVTGVSTTFTDGTVQYADYIKLSSAPDTAYAKIESVISDTQLLLENPYTGASGSGLGHHAKFKPLGAVGAITVFGSICSVVSGTTTNALTKIFRNIDYCPLIFTANVAISQRIINQTGYLGLTDDAIAPTMSAYFQFDGTNDLIIKTVTQYSAQPTEIETTTITLLTSTSTQRQYRIDLSQEYVGFYIDGNLIATHKTHIPPPYAYMDGIAGWLNGAVAPASSTTMSVDSIYIGNVDSLQIASGLLNLPVVVTNPALDPVYTAGSDFSISLQITRGTTSPYGVGNLVNNSGSSVLPPFDFSTLGNLQNRFIEVTSVIIISNNGNISTKIAPAIHLFNTNTISGSTLTDNTPFNPSYTEVIAKRVLSVDSVYTNILIGSGGVAGCYLLSLTGGNGRILRLDDTCKTYLALVATNAYAAISGEKITVILKGQLS